MDGVTGHGVSPSASFQRRRPGGSLGHKVLLRPCGLHRWIGLRPKPRAGTRRALVRSFPVMGHVHGHPDYGVYTL